MEQKNIQVEVQGKNVLPTPIKNLRELTTEVTQAGADATEAKGLAEVNTEIVADKDYDTTKFSGMGRVNLQKNIVDGHNYLTQEMVSKANTIYKIQYDYEIAPVTTGYIAELNQGTIEVEGHTFNYKVIDVNAGDIITKESGMGNTTAILYMTSDNVWHNPHTPVLTVRNGWTIAIADVVGGSTAVNYNVTTSTITIPENCVLEFEGGSISGGNLILSSQCKIFNGIFKESYIKCGDNNEIHNSVISGNNQLFLVSVIATSNVLIDNCEIYTKKSRYNQRNCSPVFVKNSSNVTITNSVVHGSAYDSNTTGAYYDDENGDYSHSVIYVKFSNYVVVSDCTLSDGANECIYLYKCNDVTIARNEISNTYYSAIASSFGNSCLYLANHCHHTGASCISVTDYSFEISNNIVHHNNYDRTPYTTNGIVAGHSNVPSENSKVVCIVANNIVHDYILNGITTSDIEDVQIIGNTIINSTEGDGSAINVSHKYLDMNVVVQSNICKGNYHGVNIYDNSDSVGKVSLKVTDNSIENFTGVGINNNATCDSIIVENNVIKNVRSGITSTAAKLVVNNNYINYSRDGLTILDPFIQVNANDNKFIKNRSSADNGAIYIAAESVPSVAIQILCKNNNFNLDNSIKLFNLLSDIIPNKSTNTVMFDSNSITSTGTITASNELNNIDYSKCKVYFYNTIVNNSYWLLDRVSTKNNLPTRISNVSIGDKCIVVSENKIYTWSGRRWVASSGTTTDRPYFETSVLPYFIGFSYFDTDLSKRIIKAPGDSYKWIEADGATAGVQRAGLITKRPALADIYAGFMYLVTQPWEDATLGTDGPAGPYYFDGSNSWILADGTSIQDSQMPARS